MDKILVAIKGSEGCNKVSKKAEELAFLCNSSVTFLTIEEPKYKFVMTEEALKDQMKEVEGRKKETEEMLNKCSIIYKNCEISMKEKGLKTNRIVKEGNNPAIDICNYAKENNFDLILIADKADKSIKEFLLGNVTEKVVRHSKISVLVVK
jgi:nucleotide-binding universal stress UspA family protein